MRRRSIQIAGETRSSPGSHRTAPKRSVEPTNADRAAWAKEALALFTARTFGGDPPDTMPCGDLECAIADLICDLLHFARQQAFATAVILRQASGNFAWELREEEVQP